MYVWDKEDKDKEENCRLPQRPAAEESQSPSISIARIVLEAI